MLYEYLRMNISQHCRYVIQTRKFLVLEISQSDGQALQGRHDGNNNNVIPSSWTAYSTTDDVILNIA